jgi:tight adherence protein B
MSASIFGLIVFAALTAGAASVVMVVRDLLFLGRKAAPESVPLRLRRLTRIPETGPQGPVASFDRWFLQMVRETGTGWSAVEATLVLVLCGTAVGGSLFVLSDRPLAALLGVFGGMGAALTYLAYRRRKRVQQLQNQLPGALDMLARSMRAGRSIDEAVQTVGRQLAEPLAAEFRLCANQMALGLSLPAVMRSLVERVRLFDVRIFTTTLTVHRQTGGNLALVLERLAAVIRDRLNYRRQLRSMTGAGRFSALLIAAIGPLLFFYLFLFQPDYVKAMLESPLGQAMLIAAFVLETIGLIWTARLLKPTY